MISISDYEDPRFLEALQAMHNIHPHIIFNTFDAVRNTKPTYEKLEENEFTFRQMTRQYNGSYDNIMDLMDLLNGELETRMQEQKMNQYGWSMQRFVKRKIYWVYYKFPFTSRYVLNIHNTDNKCLLWCLIAYLPPAPLNPNRINNYNKPEYIKEIKLPTIPPPYGYKDLQKIQEMNKEKNLFYVFNLNKNKTINPVLINHNDPKGCNILYWDNHYLLCKNVSFLLISSKNKSYTWLKFCVSFRTDDALNKLLELCYNNGRRTFHNNDYLKFDKIHYKNRVPFAMHYDFECIIKDSNKSNKNKKHIPIAFGIYIKSDYPDILEERYESYCGGRVVDWFLSRMSYYNELFKDIFNINFPLKEYSITTLYSSCY